MPGGLFHLEASATWSTAICMDAISAQLLAFVDFFFVLSGFVIAELPAAIAWMVRSGTFVFAATGRLIRFILSPCWRWVSPSSCADL